jgi:UDP-N-acetylmuramyl pentapeptide phosphotransferase/UDP-N-acetylglucosamine-1-phosphate transferase
MLHIAILALAASTVTCLILLLKPQWHMSFSRDLPQGGVQKLHQQPIARIGGLGVVCGLIISSAFVGQEWQRFFWSVLACALPFFVVGFMEDVTRQLPVGLRFFLTLLSGAAAFVLLDARLLHSDVAWLDRALTLAPISFAATLFAIAGIVHAMNIIDGLNGLCSGVGIIALLALAHIGSLVGDTGLVLVCYVVAASYSGFLIFNYPMGRLFLGDGGAYLIGALIAVVSALLIRHHQEVSPWFPFVLVVYPAWETVFSVLRRRLLDGAGAGRADARHLHSLIYLRWSGKLLPARYSNDQHLRNAAATLPLWLLEAALALLAVVFYKSTNALMAVSGIFIAAYSLVYLRLAMGSPVVAATERA